jgi:hypothetical protein
VAGDDTGRPSGLCRHCFIVTRTLHRCFAARNRRSIYDRIAICAESDRAAPAIAPGNVRARTENRARWTRWPDDIVGPDGQRCRAIPPRARSKAERDPVHSTPLHRHRHPYIAIDIATVLILVRMRITGLRGAAIHHWQYSDATAITFRHRDSSPGRSGVGRVS